MASSQPVLAAFPQPSFARLGRRLAARLLDSLISSSVLIVVAITMRVLHELGLWVPIARGIRPEGISPQDAWHMLGVGAKLSVVVGYALSLGPVYFVLFEASPWQATFGKRLLGIYVTNDDGKRIGIGQSLGRGGARLFFDWLGLSLISILTVAFTKKRSALHDVFSDTFVLSGKASPGGSLERWRIAAAFGLPFLWLVGTFLATI